MYVYAELSLIELNESYAQISDIGLHLKSRWKNVQQNPVPFTILLFQVKNGWINWCSLFCAFLTDAQSWILMTVHSVLFNVYKWTWGGKVTQLLPGIAVMPEKRKLQWARTQCRMLCSYLYSLFTLLGNRSCWVCDPKCLYWVLLLYYHKGITLFLVHLDFKARKIIDPVEKERLWK